MLRAATLLAINLLFLMVWGFSAIDKVRTGMPAWFGEKFGPTILGKFPGVTASFWLLTAAELLAFGLAMVALFRLEFLERRSPAILAATVVCSLFLFVQLGFGNWLISEFNATHQHFMYFSGTLIALGFVAPGLKTPR